MGKGGNEIFIGIDLAGSPNRNTGICILDEKKNAYTCIVKTDKEIIDKIKEFSHKKIFVGIDAPLSLPEGRKDINEKGPHFRKCDMELRKLGIKFFPITLGPMRKLTERGMKLKKKILEIKKDIFTAEVFPGALYDIFSVPRKSKKDIEKFFKAEGIKIKTKCMYQDELDAIACAYSVYLFNKGKAKEIGDKKEGTIIIPTR